MKVLSFDLRERIVASYDEGKSTREEIAKRYQVSLGMVKKLLLQRRKTGSLRARYDRCGRKPLILESHRQQMRTLLRDKPDLTLEELRVALQLACTLPAIYYALAALGLTYKKRRSGPANKAAPTSSRSGGRGGGAVGTPPPPPWWWCRGQHRFRQALLKHAQTRQSRAA